MSGGGSTGSSPQQLGEQDVMRWQEDLEKALKNDAAMHEYAPGAVVASMFKRADHFDDCEMREECRNKMKVLTQQAKDTKLLAAALRKCVNELLNMQKAVTKARDKLAAKANQKPGKVGTLRLGVHVLCNSLLPTIQRYVARPMRPFLAKPSRYFSV